MTSSFFGKRHFGLALASAGALLPAQAAYSQRPAASPKPSPQIQALVDKAKKIEDQEVQFQRFREAADAARTQHDPPGEALATEQAAETAGNVLPLPDALEWAKRSERLYRALHDADGIARSRAVIGEMTFFLGDWKTAFGLLSKSHQTLLSLRDYIAAGSALSGLGIVDDALGQTEKALQAQQQAIYLLRRGERDFGEEAATMSNLGVHYMTSGNAAKALTAFGESIRLARRAGNLASESITWGNIADLYADRGKISVALDCFQTALHIQLSVHDHRDVPTSYLNLGTVYEDLGESAKALEYMKLALSGYQRTGEASGQATVLNNLGWLDGDGGRFDAGMSELIRAADMAQKLSDLPLAAKATSNQGVLLSRKTMWAPALAKLGAALQFARQAKDRRTEARCLEIMAEIRIKMGRYHDSARYLQQALTLAQEVGDPNYLAAILDDLGEAYGHTGQPVLGIFNLKLAVNTYQSVRAGLRPLPREDQIAFRKQNADTYRRLAAALHARGRFLEEQKALALLKDFEYFHFLAVMAPHGVDMTPAEKASRARYEWIGRSLAKDAARYDHLKALEEHWTLTAAERKELGRLQGRIDRANAVYEAFARDEERLLERSWWPRHPKPGHGGPRNVAEVYAYPSADGVVEFVSLRSVTLVVHDPRLRVPFPKLDAEIVSLRDSFRHHDSSHPGLVDFYDMLIRPIEKDLRANGVTTLDWFLDGPLRYIPVAGLYDRQTGKYLVESYECRIVTPGRSPAPAPNPRWDRAAAFYRTTPAEARGVDFPSLPGALAEMEVLKELFHVKPYLEKDFTAQALYHEAQEPFKVIHVCSHFWLMDGSAEGSFLLLGHKSDSLSLTEIRRWNLGPVGPRLFVFSACDTATPVGEEPDGFELEGLARILGDKGVGEVVATLWPVDDASTALLMRDFYYALKHEHLPTPKALQAAQIRMLRERSKENPSLKDPYYWAGFVAEGGP